MMTIVTRRPALLLLALLLAACGGGGGEAPATGNADAGGEAPAQEAAEVDLGPMEYDASGTMPCSAGSSALDEACGFRVVRDGSGGAEIWISNIASEVKPAYRVLIFSDGSFRARDGSPLEVSQDVDTWTVVAEDGGHFRFPDAVITGG